MKRRNLFWGVFLVLAAVLVVAGQITGFAELGFWNILCGILLAAVLVQSLAGKNITMSLLAVALLYIVFQKPLNFYYIQPWLLLLAAVLAGVGLTIIIRPRRRRYVETEGRWVNGHWTNGEPAPALSAEQSGDDNNPEVSVSFGGSIRYLYSTALQRAVLRASFGSLEVYLDQAIPAPGGADIILDCSFGAIKLYVPRGWQVTDDVAVSIGAVQHDSHQARPEPGAPQLRLLGNVSIGAVQVDYV